MNQFKKGYEVLTSDFGNSAKHIGRINEMNLFKTDDEAAEQAENSKMETKYGIDQVSVRLVKEATVLSERKISTAEDAVSILGDLFKDYDREVLGVIHIRSDMVPINMIISSIGTLNQSLVHPREILKAAFLSNANSIILFHNHPSGSINPSKCDIEITGRMQQICTLAGIPLLDHVIVGKDKSYFSFREKEILPDELIHYSDDLNDIDLKMAEKKAEIYR